MDEKEKVIYALRATLLSVKGAQSIKQCNRDFRELQGEWIPYKKLGYQALEHLFKDVQGFTVFEKNGELFVDAIPNENTQHVVDLVARQKNSKKSRLSKSRCTPKENVWRKPSSQSSFSNNYDNQYSKQYYSPNAPANRFNHNNNIKVTKHLPSVKSQPDPKRQPVTLKSSELRVNSQDNKQVLKPSVKSQPDPKPVTSKPSVSRVNSQETKQIKSKIKTNFNEAATNAVKISAAQRLSNLRERINTIPLNLPAITNECMESNDLPQEIVVPVLDLPPVTTSSVQKLEWTCHKLCLPDPVYKVLSPEKKGTQYYCSIKVGTSYSATSYPEGFPTEDQAKEVAALKVLLAIESSEAPGLPTSDNETTILNLSSLVAEHDAGIYAMTVTHLYREKYRENMPLNWKILIENCQRISIDIVNGLQILHLKKKLESTPINEQINNKVIEVSSDYVDNELPPLQFPEENYWNAYVTVANSSLEIWLRIIGKEYSDALDNLLQDMNEHYSNSKAPVENLIIEENALYAVGFQDAGWHRGKVLDVDGEFATIFLTDHGDDEKIPISNLRVLEAQYRKLPAQAILCRLEGAEELAASALGCELVKRRLLDEVLVAAPAPRDDSTEPTVSVILYDTSTTRDLNLNNEIIQDFCITGVFNINQKLCEVEVPCVTDDGRVWVSCPSGTGLVRAALALLTSPGPYRRHLPASPHAPDPDARTLYIVRTMNGDWVRCTIISELDGEGTVRTQLVDSGLILRAPLSSLVPLQSFSKALNIFPFQALQVQLAGMDRLVGNMSKRLRELLVNQSVLCRGLPGSHQIPHVELFMRTGPQNVLASVYSAILMEYEYSQHEKPKEIEGISIDHVEALQKKKERIFTKSTSSGGLVASEDYSVPKTLPINSCPKLPPPSLPALGKCFDVFVSMAANPWNFVIQPNVTRTNLQAMMASLQKECPKLSESEAPSNPIIGELYTAYYDKDDSWYRVVVAGTMFAGLVPVYFCDFGDMALFSSSALRPVPDATPSALILPPQAIKARLHDIAPLHHDWSVEDCILFQHLCMEQQFVGICKEITNDSSNYNELLLTLDLIDTSTDEDIYVNKQMVAEGRGRLSSQDNTL